MNYIRLVKHRPNLIVKSLKQNINVIENKKQHTLNLNKGRNN
jgi:hypothetical protein